MKLIDYSDPNSLANGFRRKHMKWLVEIVRFVIQMHKLSEMRICDIGGTASYWRNFPFESFHEISFQIDLINLEYPDNDIEVAHHVAITKLVGNGCDLSNISNQYYHIAHSNSVIEHVGVGRQVEAMALELQRVSRYYYIQTPNFWFPVEPHFLIPFYAILPRPWRVWLQVYILRVADLPTAIDADDAVRLLTRKEMYYLFPDGEMLVERLVGFPKSIVVRTRLEDQSGIL